MLNNSFLVKLFAITIVLLLVAFSFLAEADNIPESSIRRTKHNLSGSLSKWPNPDSNIRAVYEAEICIFCHTPHNANPAQPLWNHEPSAVESYKVYWSDTLQSYSETQSQAWRIDGYSKLCLSCHDGTVAVGAVQSRAEEILMVANECIDASGRLINGTNCKGYIGTDLSGGHPISIVYDESLVTRRNGCDSNLSNCTNRCWLNSPPSNRTSPVKLYPTDNQGGGLGVQCTSCHNPHTNRSQEIKNGVKWPPFWQGTGYDEVCIVCHSDDCGVSYIWPW